MATVLIGGDCGPAHGPDDGYPVEHYTSLIKPILSPADFRLVNCMRTYSSMAPIVSEAPQVAQPVHMAEIYRNAGIDGVTMANNHAYDSGPDALIDTRNLFEKYSIQVTGAGKNITEARKPVILEKDGVRIAYLGCTSVGKAGSYATDQKIGVRNIGIETTYEHRGAHAPVRIRTEPNEDELQELMEDVRSLRSSVDHVIVAFHSGVIRLPRVISDYQVTVAHALVDAGADLVVCHAPHILKGVEVYKGKTIFYSIGVFAMTKPLAADGWKEPAWAHGAIRNHADLDPGYPFMPYGADSRYSMLVKGEFGKGSQMRISFLPMYIDNTYRPFTPEPEDSRFDEILDYVEWASADLPHRFEVQGNEVLVTE